jgi:hypothetical protein
MLTNMGRTIETRERVCGIKHTEKGAEAWRPAGGISRNVPVGFDRTGSACESQEAQQEEESNDMDHQHKCFRDVHVLAPSNIDNEGKKLHADSRYERGSNMIFSRVEQYHRGDIETKQPSGRTKERQPRECKDTAAKIAQEFPYSRRRQRCNPMVLSCTIEEFVSKRNTEASDWVE